MMESSKIKSVAMIDSNSESDMSDSEFKNLAKKPKLDTEKVKGVIKRKKLSVFLQPKSVSISPRKSSSSSSNSSSGSGDEWDGDGEKPRKK